MLKIEVVGRYVYFWSLLMRKMNWYTDFN